MRLASWATCVKLTKTRVPQNLGFFWYCEGNCARNIWNDDPDIPANERGPQRLYFIEHTRRFLARHKVGMDVLERHLKPELAFDYAIDQVKAGKFRPVWVQVHNTRDASWYVDAKQATLRDVKLELVVPPGLYLPKRNSPPAQIMLGDIGADDYRAALWWAKTKQDTTISSTKPMRVRLTTANCPSVEMTATVPDVTPPGMGVHELCRSGDSWIEPTYRVGDAFHPIVALRPLGWPAMRPSLTDGADTLMYNGTLHVGEELVVGPGHKARLLPADLVRDDVNMLRDPAGPHGAKAWDKGYGVFSLRLMNPSRPGAKVRVTISGQVAGGAASMVLLFGSDPATREPWSQALLVNAFKETWREGVSAECTLPPNVVLGRLLAYRRNNKGTIWYGRVAVTLAGVPDKGIDVTERLEGVVPTLSQGTYTRFTYTDASAPRQVPRVRVQLTRPAP